jgi:hypothetical protein
MRHIHPFKAGVSVGIVIALWHACWVLLVGLGWAKPILDFVLKLHFIQLQYQLEPYSAVTATMLIALTFAIGMLFGLIFAVVWNWLGAAPAAARGHTQSRRAEA